MPPNFVHTFYNGHMLVFYNEYFRNEILKIG